MPNLAALCVRCAIRSAVLCCVVGLMLVVLSACSGEAQRGVGAGSRNRSAGVESSESATSVAAVDVLSGAAGGDVGSASSTDASANRGVSGLTALNSAPFGAADIFLSMRNEPDAVLRWLEPQDVPGALWHRPSYAWGGVAGRVLDLCMREDAAVSLLRRRVDPGEPLDPATLTSIRNLQHGLGCGHAPRVEGIGGRYFYMSHLGPSPYFDNREHAQAWGMRHRNLIAGTLPEGAWPVGLLLDGTALGVEYSYNGAEVDKVSVVPQSVTVRDGVMRGLVRNWSRSLWAFGTTVTAEGFTWHWPLSVQPGEIAPFEIRGLDGAVDPAEIEISVAARFSPKADLSRSFVLTTLHARHESLSTLARWVEADGYEPDILERVQRGVDLVAKDEHDRTETGSDSADRDVRWYTVSAEFKPPTSHPSFAADSSGLVVDTSVNNLRAYLAYITPQSSELLDLTYLPIDVLEHYTDERGNSRSRGATVTRMPHVVADGYAIESATLQFPSAYPLGYIVWIGSVYNSAE